MAERLGDVAVYNGNETDVLNKPDIIFIDGVPFRVIGVKKRLRLNFLIVLDYPLMNLMKNIIFL